MTTNRRRRKQVFVFQDLGQNLERKTSIKEENDMRVLIFGGSGMLGHVLVKHFVNMGHDVTFTIKQKMPSWMPLNRPVKVFKFDAQKDSIPNLSDYDVVINCIGKIPQDNNCSFQDYYEVNAVFPWKIALKANESNCLFFQISSDCVFSGASATGYIATDSPDSKDDYGRSKAFGEVKNAVVIRTSIIGPSPDKKLGLFEWFKNTKKTKPVSGYANHIWSGVTTLFLAEFIEAFATQKDFQLPQEGMLVQLASEPISKYDLLNAINDVFKFGANIEKFHMKETINRTLFPNGFVQAPKIKDQLESLKKWIENFGE